MSTILDMGIPGVGTGTLMPRQKNRFRLTFANFAGGTDSQPLSMSVVTTTRPKLTFEKIELHRYVNKSMIAGKYSWDPMQTTVHDDVRGQVATVIQQQIQQQQWLTGAEGQWLGAAGEGSLYKFVAYLETLDGKDQVTETWTLEGCWLEGVDYGENTYENAEAATIAMTISFDNARQTNGGYAQGPGQALGGVGSTSA